MKIYSDKTVLEESLDRIRYLYGEFKNIVVFFSGGKDSTTVLELNLMVARELNRLPVKVMFIDQEAEWLATDEYVSEVMHRPEVEPYWLQCPIRLSNATSGTDTWLYCWKEGDEWVRPKSEISIHENIYGEMTFKKVFNAFTKKMFPDEPVACMGGVRSQESPARNVSLTTRPKYKHITWAKYLNKELGHYTFYPIYDWEISDLWKFIHEHGLKYNSIYDKMWQYGIPINKMRVSNLHHQTAVWSLFFLQELEPENWVNIQKRLKGINTAGHMGKEDYFIKEVPKMFTGPREYRDYLLEKLIPEGPEKETFKKQFKKMDTDYEGCPMMEKIYMTEINAILVNDSFMVKLGDLLTNPKLGMWKRKADKMRKGN